MAMKDSLGLLCVSYIKMRLQEVLWKLQESEMALKTDLVADEVLLVD